MLWEKKIARMLLFWMEELENNLHWLLVHFIIRYKILLLTYRALNGQSPTYISDLITVHTATLQGLRSAGQTLLHQGLTALGVIILLLILHLIFATLYQKTSGLAHL